MHIAKKIGLVFVSVLLSLTVVFGIIFGSIQANFNNGEQLKKWLVASKLYEGVRATLLEQLTKDTTEDEQEAAIPKEVIKRALSAAVTAEILQRVSEGAIDGTHTWLSGETEKPAFAVKLSSAKNTFADTVIERAEKRLKTLPPCVLADQAVTDNPFTINCRPSGALLTLLKKEFRARINKDSSVLPDTFTADTQFGNSNQERKEKVEKAKAWYEQARKVPDWYQRTMIAQWWFLAAGAILAALSVFLGRDKRHGIKAAATTVGGSALMLAISAGILLIFMGGYNTDSITTEVALQEPIASFITIASRAIARWQIVVSLILVFVSAGVLFALHQTKPQPNATKKEKRPTT